MAILVLREKLVFLIVHTFLFCIVFAYIKNDKTNVKSLLEFKSRITSDPLQVMQSWNESTPLCQWYGVTCGSRHKRVQKLYLNSSKITGTISPFVGNLSFLRELDLENNSFIGNIPPEIGRLQRLRILALSNNSLNGRIPSNISNCYDLEVMAFYGNHFEGEVFAELGSFPKLIFLSLRRNNLHGRIPPSLGNLSNLKTIDLSENKLTGVLPDTLGQLNRLARFGASFNRLSGSIPPSMFNISSLSEFIVSENFIHGSLPPNLFNTLPNLLSFTISSNKISGNIPISLSNASNLAVLGTSLNKFTGKFPSLEKLHKLRVFAIGSNHHGYGVTDDLGFLCSLTNCTNLEVLSLEDNNFGGMLPKCIGNLSSIVQLFMDDNNITGPIPIEIGNLINIQRLRIGENQLSGEIPSSIGNLEMLVSLHFGDNKLSGNIPSSLGKLKQLNLLSLGNNKLQGAIPHTLGQCDNLNVLYLYANDLDGSIPFEIFQISSLIEIDVSQNHFSGPLLELVGNLEHLNMLNISENMFSQMIPNSLGKCTNLQQLYMQGNLFEGTIPPSLGSLRGIDVIDLSRNNISGTIPESLANLMLLRNLNLSYNNLEGPVPEFGVFKNASIFSIIGNKKLCGGIPELILPKCNIKISHKKASHVTIKVVLCVFGGLFGVSLICLWLYCKGGKKKNTASQNSPNDPFLRLSYHDLLKATNDFSLANKLGSGSFGSVYKAILDASEAIVAVKVFDLQRHGASRSFLAECEVLKTIRHRNLVKILTACSGIDFSGNEFKALVYEFMMNGSLEDWLHPLPTRETMNQPLKHLNLDQRLNIAIDVACALDYLHHQCEIPIVHRDVKPTNVLLDDEMIAHVSDFGVSKILLDASGNTKTGQTSSIGLQGTIGYIAPEYGMGTSVSTQGDVYSYGVLLLEIFTGKRPNDGIFHGSINLNQFVRAALPDKVVEVVDPTLHAAIEELSNAEKPVLEHLIAIFEVGVSCTAYLPRERKSMRSVVGELKYIRNTFSKY